jgi:hypothetical protein
MEVEGGGGLHRGTIPHSWSTFSPASGVTGTISVPVGALCVVFVQCGVLLGLDLVVGPPGTVLEGGGGRSLAPNGTVLMVGLFLGSGSLGTIMVPVGALWCGFCVQWCSLAGSVVGPTPTFQELVLEGGFRKFILFTLWNFIAGQPFTLRLESLEPYLGACWNVVLCGM